MEQSNYKKGFMKHFRTRYGFVLLSLFALFAFVLSSCEINKVYEEYYVNSKTINYLVKATDWRSDVDDSGSYLYYTFNEPELTKDIFEYGLVVAYLSINNSLSPLPFEDSWIVGGVKWTEQVTCEFKPGSITFIFKTTDHSLEPYYDYDFVLKMMW
jgi:hypothetical protein